MSLEVKPHPLEDKLFELQTKAKNLRAVEDAKKARGAG